MTLSAALAAPLSAQSPSDDPYGIESPSTPAPTPPAPTPNTTPSTDTVRTTPPPPVARDTALAAPVVVDTAPAPKAPVPRARVTRETTVNPMDTHRGNYRNPKKALFMSLLVPGLGQAYIGQNKFNYIRAAAYFTAEVTMGIMWYQFSVVKYDRKVKEYRTLADQHWNQSAYEAKIGEVGLTATQVYFEQLNPNRIGYCGAVQANVSHTEQNLYAGCIDPYTSTNSQKYNDFVNSVSVAPGSATTERRAAFPDDVSFYEMIGAKQEFIFGWDDVAADPGFPLGSSNPGVGPDTSWTGLSAYRNDYNGMRQQAKDYSRMQTWFLGGIVLNHIASAVDAAVTARRHNRILYEDAEARWYDKISLDGGMAFDQGRPRTHMMAYLSF